MSEYLRRLFRRHPRRSPVEIVDILLNRCYPSPFAGAGRRQHERAGGREREREKEENKKEIRKSGSIQSATVLTLLRLPRRVFKRRANSRRRPGLANEKKSRKLPVQLIRSVCDWTLLSANPNLTTTNCWNGHKKQTKRNENQLKDYVTYKIFQMSSWPSSSS